MSIRFERVGDSRVLDDPGEMRVYSVEMEELSKNEVAVAIQKLNNCVADAIQGGASKISIQFDSEQEIIFIHALRPTVKN